MEILQETSSLRDTNGTSSQAYPYEPYEFSSRMAYSHLAGLRVAAAVLGLHALEQRVITRLQAFSINPGEISALLRDHDLQDKAVQMVLETLVKQYMLCSPRDGQSHRAKMAELEETVRGCETARVGFAEAFWTEIRERPPVADEPDPMHVGRRPVRRQAAVVDGRGGVDRREGCGARMGVFLGVTVVVEGRGGRRRRGGGREKRSWAWRRMAFFDALGNVGSDGTNCVAAIWRAWYRAVSLSLSLWGKMYHQALLRLLAS